MDEELECSGLPKKKSAGRKSAAPYCTINPVLGSGRRSQICTCRPETNETRADIAKFTDVEPHIWTSEIEAKGCEAINL